MIPSPILQNVAVNSRYGTYKPSYTIISTDRRTEPTLEEMKLYTEFAVSMDFDQLILLPNANSRLDSLFPPSGYVALTHSSVGFKAEAFLNMCLFAGMARFRVQWPTRAVRSASASL